MMGKSGKVKAGEGMLNFKSRMRFAEVADRGKFMLNVEF